MSSQPTPAPAAHSESGKPKSRFRWSWLAVALGLFALDVILTANMHSKPLKAGQDPIQVGLRERPWLVFIHMQVLYGMSVCTQALLYPVASCQRRRSMLARTRRSPLGWRLTMVLAAVFLFLSYSGPRGFSLEQFSYQFVSGILLAAAVAPGVALEARRHANRRRLKAAAAAES